MALTARGRWTNGIIDDRGRRVFSNGLDERGRKVFGLTGGNNPRTQIGTVKIKTSSTSLVIPVYQLISTDTLRIQTPNGVGAFVLVPTGDANASPIRIQTNSGVKSISK
jgi:hypothetical protein